MNPWQELAEKSSFGKPVDLEDKVIGLNQRTFLCERIKEIFPGYDPDKTWYFTAGMAEPVYKYLLALYYNDKGRFLSVIKEKLDDQQ